MRNREFDLDEDLGFDFKGYQKEVVEGRLVKDKSLIDYLVYGACGLNEEAGEVAGKLKKIIRDKNSIVTEQDKKELAKELGDVLWYITDLSYDLGFSLEEIAKINQVKIRERISNNTVQGNGDNR